MRKNPSKVGFDTRGTYLSFGSFGLKAVSAARIRSEQIESARKVISREIGKNGKLWIRIFPDKPVTKKPAETRMGKGKGSVDQWVAVIKPGRILFEMQGIEEEVAYEALRLAGFKLPIKTKFVKRTDPISGQEV